MMKTSERLCRFHDILTKLAAILAAILLGLIVTSYVYEVVARYFFNSPTSWVSDFVSYALAASVFLAIPQVTQDNAHVAVTIVVDLIPAKIADMVYTIVSLIGFGCLAFAAYVSSQENIRQYVKGIETLAINPIPQWWISGFITFGLAMSALHMLRNAPSSNRKNATSLVGEAS